MALPQVTYPVHETTLEATGEKVKYRAFSSDEEKILLQCKESKDLEFIKLNFKTIINNCTFDKINVDEMAVFDIEKLFLSIRGKSVGDTVDLKYKCKKEKLDDDGKQVYTKKVINKELVDVPATCDTPIKIEFDIKDIDMKAGEGHKTLLEISDGIKLEMCYPKLDTSFDDIGVEKDISRLISMCIKSVIDVNDKVFYLKDEKEEEVNEWIRNVTSNPDNKKKVEEFFNTMPKLQHTVNYKCETCGNKGDITLKGLKDFF